MTLSRRSFIGSAMAAAVGLSGARIALPAPAAQSDSVEPVCGPDALTLMVADDHVYAWNGTGFVPLKEGERPRFVPGRVVRV